MGRFVVVALFAVGLMAVAQWAHAGLEGTGFQCGSTRSDAACVRARTLPWLDASAATALAPPADYVSLRFRSPGPEAAATSQAFLADADHVTLSTWLETADVSFTQLAAVEPMQGVGTWLFSAASQGHAIAVDSSSIDDDAAVQVTAVPLPGAAGLLLFGLFALRPRQFASQLRSRFSGNSGTTSARFYAAADQGAEASAVSNSGSTRLLLVSLNFSPELTGIGKYSGEMVDGWIARGHQVTVVCAPPYYPAWRVQAGHTASGYRTEQPVPGLTIYRCPLWVPKRPGGAARLLHLASFAASSFPVLMALVLWQPRVVFVVAPALFCAPVAWLAARLAGAKAWLHVQDLEIDAAFELGLLKQPQMRKMAQWAETRLLRRFDIVSTISRRMLRKLADKGVDSQRLEMLPNWVDLSAVRHGLRSEGMRCSLGIAPSQTVCLYSGTINRKQGLCVVVAAARQLQHDPRMVFVVCGNGEMRPELEASAAGLDNLRFMDLQPASQLNELLNMADIHLLPQLRGAADLVMPSKLVGMLASGRPVIAAAAQGSEIAETVVGCGIVVEPECADGFVRAIVALTDDADRRSRLGGAGRRHAEHVLDAKNIFECLHMRLMALDRQQGLPQSIAGGAPPHRVAAQTAS